MVDFLKAMKAKSNDDYNSDAVCVKEYAYCEDMNARMSMEDDHFILDDVLDDGESGLFGVLDGHGGQEVVRFCAKTVPELFKKLYKPTTTDIAGLFTTIFQKVDDQLKLVGASESGATIGVIFIRKEAGGKTLYSINLGDTRAVLARTDGVERLSTDHKASDLAEQKRVADEGGIISKNRVGGSLAVSRALGDLGLKKEGVSNVPSVKAIRLTPDDKFLIMASDGLWDVIEDKAAVDIAKQGKNAQEMAKKLLRYAIDNDSKDNVSVMILKLN